MARDATTLLQTLRGVSKFAYDLRFVHLLWDPREACVAQACAVHALHAHRMHAASMPHAATAVALPQCARATARARNVHGSVLYALYSAQRACSAHAAHMQRTCSAHAPQMHRSGP